MCSCVEKLHWLAVISIVRLGVYLYSKGAYLYRCMSYVVRCSLFQSKTDVNVLKHLKQPISVQAKQMD